MNNIIKVCFALNILILLSACDAKQEKAEAKIVSTVSENMVDIAPDLSSEYIKAELEGLPTSLLNVLKKNKEDRLEYIRGSYAEKELLKVVSSKKLDNNKRLQREFTSLKNDIYINELVRLSFKDRLSEIENLARDRYALNKNKYTTRRRIQIAQIFIKKYDRELEKSKKIIEEVADKLKNKEREKTDFFKLAIEYSDDKENAQRGGVYEKWLIYPEDSSKLNSVLRAAFSLKKVDDISDVIETRQGFHIIKLISDKPSIQNSFDSIKLVLIDEVKNEVLSKVKDDVKGELYPPKGFEYDDEALNKLIDKVKSNRSPDSVN